MSFIKDRASIKYYIIALICVFCVYSANISKLFIPIFDDIYYGNLVKMFVSLTNFLIWIIEIKNKSEHIVCNEVVRICFYWGPIRESNPRFQRERLAS